MNGIGLREKIVRQFLVINKKNVFIGGKTSLRLEENA